MTFMIFNLNLITYQMVPKCKITFFTDTPSFLILKTHVESIFSKLLKQCIIPAKLICCYFTSAKRGRTMVHKKVEQKYTVIFKFKML